MHASTRTCARTQSHARRRTRTEMRSHARKAHTHARRHTPMHTCTHTLTRMHAGPHVLNQGRQRARCLRGVWRARHKVGRAQRVELEPMVVVQVGAPEVSEGVSLMRRAGLCSREHHPHSFSDHRHGPHHIFVYHHILIHHTPSSSASSPLCELCAPACSQGRARTRRQECSPSPGADVARGERSPGADVAAVEYRMANVRPEWCHDSPSHTVAYGRST